MTVNQSDLDMLKAQCENAMRFVTVSKNEIESLLSEIARLRKIEEAAKGFLHCSVNDDPELGACDDCHARLDAALYAGKEPSRE